MMKVFEQILTILLWLLAIPVVIVCFVLVMPVLFILAVIDASKQAFPQKRQKEGEDYE